MRPGKGFTVGIQGLVLLLGMAVTSGCTVLQGVQEQIAYNDAVNDYVLGWRNRAWASQAWLYREGQFAGQPHLRSFGEGFRAGYMDVAAGSNGCTPALPPRKYWNWRYQTPEGQGKVAAWFAGYPHGAKAAEEDGAGLYQHIQVSETMRAEYRLGHEAPYSSPIFLHNPANWCPPPGQMIPGEVVPGEQVLPDASVPLGEPVQAQPDAGAWIPPSATMTFQPLPPTPPPPDRLGANGIQHTPSEWNP